MPMTTRLVRRVNYFERLLPIKSCDYIITWSCEFRGQTENISSLPKCLWPQNLAE